MGLFDLFGGGAPQPTPSARALKQRTGTEQQRADTGYGQYQDLMSEGQPALETSISSAMSAAMPEFQKAMQGVQESEVQRGVGLGASGSSGGSLGTSYEGDLESAFQRNIANAAGSQALGLYSTKLGTAAQGYQLDENRLVGMMSGNRDYETALQNAAKKRSSGLFGALGAGIGGIAGGSFGADIGGDIGAAFGS
ncbi:MAG TPA: hypothetical protein VEU74_12145 [Gemmatimonadales bacterium]|nr:hypothetical protein [Gemmatimonadales bacterium]